MLQQGSKYQVLFRLWPGTQRHLLSGDPELAAAYGRTANFCGAAGIDIMEPLSFKGREGSGLPGGRCAYADASLNPTDQKPIRNCILPIAPRLTHFPRARSIWARAIVRHP